MLFASVDTIFNLWCGVERPGSSGRKMSCAVAVMMPVSTRSVTVIYLAIFFIICSSFRLLDDYFSSVSHIHASL